MSDANVVIVASNEWEDGYAASVCEVMVRAGFKALVAPDLTSIPSEAVAFVPAALVMSGGLSAQLRSRVIAGCRTPRECTACFHDHPVAALYLLHQHDLERPTRGGWAIPAIADTGAPPPRPGDAAQIPVPLPGTLSAGEFLVMLAQRIAAAPSEELVRAINDR